MGRREAKRRGGASKVPSKPTRRRACPKHGWINAVQRASDLQWMCPIDGLNAMTEREYMISLSERNARRLLGTGG